jgi:hypothetical protein
MLSNQGYYTALLWEQLYIAFTPVYLETRKSKERDVFNYPSILLLIPTNIPPK